MNINLKMINENGTILEFKGYISYSSDDKLQIMFNPNPDLSNIQINSRFIIGTIFPKVYKVVGINEYAKNMPFGEVASNSIFGESISFTLRQDQLNPMIDNLELRIANYYKNGEGVNL